jgi:glutamyl-tRNA reductase
MSMTSGNWRLAVVYINHATSTLEEREPLQIRVDELAEANVEFGNLPQVLESAIVPTCNRVEFYFCTQRANEPFDVVAEFFHRWKGIDISSRRRQFRYAKNLRAAEHLFRVAAGIDSMVIGENQVFGQVKDAYSSACSVKTAGKVIHRVFHQAFRVGKQVRTDTGMGQGACSVSSAAVEMLRERVGHFDQPSILLVGLNRMIDLAARNLVDIEGARFRFVNRTAHKAVAYADKFKSEGFGFEELPPLLTQCDILISCTASAEPVITRNMISTALSARGGRRLIVVDLAVPRDVDYPKNADGPVQVYDLQDIKEFVKHQQKQREQAIPEAEEIIDLKLSEFNYWFRHVMLEPIYAGRSNGLESIRKEELNAVLSELPPDHRAKIDRATRRIVDRIVQITSRAAAGKPE